MSTAYVSREQFSDTIFELSVSSVSCTNYAAWLDNAIIIKCKGDELQAEREFTIFCNKLRLLGLDLVEE